MAASKAPDASNMTNTKETTPANIIDIAKKAKKKGKEKRQPYDPSSQSLLYHYVDAPPELKGTGGPSADPLLDEIVGANDIFLVDDPGLDHKRYVRCEGAAYRCPAKWVAP